MQCLRPAVQIKQCQEHSDPKTIQLTAKQIKKIKKAKNNQNFSKYGKNLVCYAEFSNTYIQYNFSIQIIEIISK